MAEEEKIKLTQQGFQDLQDELSERKTTKKAEIEARIAEARAQGDLSENSEYDEAKDEQAKNEARIREIEFTLKNAEILADDEISKTIVTTGGKVTIRDEETKEEIEYTMVNEKEQDIFMNKISMDSPIGKAIAGKKKGQVVEVTTAVGTYKYKIVKISK
ncbi:MAG: transcription elongation factor GreA [Clostridiales bacterium]|nr:transcription elongation factor GreA [Clostridiales bacterium]